MFSAGVAMTEKEKRAAGLPYNATDPEIFQDWMSCSDKCFEFNNIRPSDIDARYKLLKSIFGKIGERVVIQSPFFCDLGYNVKVGTNFFANHGCTILDTAKVTFGDNVFIGPNCSFNCAIHPLDSQDRIKWTETAKPIHVGNNVWFGASVTVLPGVTIGDNAVIGAGSLVTKDIPANTLAYGSPCRPVREIG